MAPRSGEPGSAPVRRFFLARSPGGEPPELLREDAEHALRVLRIQAGDRLIGLDGRGGSWPLAVVSAGKPARPGRPGTAPAPAGKGGLELEPAGAGRIDPAPGCDGATLPWIEIAAPWPKGSHLEEMLDRLTQLGAAAVAELPTERDGSRPSVLSSTEPVGGTRRARVERVLREACKQSGRTWLPELRDAPSTTAAETILLDPAASTDLASWILERRTIRPWPWTAEHPLSVLVGPEGGFTDAERGAFVAGGAVPLRLGPHALRIETAAEAAMAILGTALSAPPRLTPPRP